MHKNGCDPRPVHEVYMMDSAITTGLAPVIQLSPVNTIPRSVFHSAIIYRSQP